MSDLFIPDVAGLSILKAALAYAQAGWYLGPLRHRTKNPGSVLGADWNAKTSRDPEVIRGWFPDDTDRGLFLHAGRSGAVILDVDTPESLHPLIARAVAETDPPWQATRPATPDRKHLIFQQPEGRSLGNSVGGLNGGWGEVRGLNGVIVAAPSEHEDSDGEYGWGLAGRVPVLPAYCADELPDALAAADAATDADVKECIDSWATGDRLDALAVQVDAWERKVADGESRHDSMTGHLAGALKEAAAGLYPAQVAADTLEGLFLDAVAVDGHGRQGKARSPSVAASEWDGLLAWAVAQARAADPADTLARTSERVPGVEDDFDVIEDEPVKPPRFSFRRGGGFILDTSPDAVPVWGRGTEVLMAEGEALLVASPQGLGKTTIAQQFALARCGLRTALLGYPIEPGRMRVLYLAMDRPKQAARSFQRMVTADQRAYLDDRLVVWEGPPPKDMALDTDLLAAMCAAANADTVIVDSLKDAALNLSEDGPGSAWNRSRQTALQAGVEVLELHHNRKKQQGVKGAPTIDEIYGSTWITAGAGSVILLAGQPGDLIVGLHHVKQPADPVGPLQILHDHDAGSTSIYHLADLVAVAAASKGGITAREAAESLFDTGNPTANEKKKAERRLIKLEEIGFLVVVQKGDAATKTPTRWGRA